MSAKDKHFYPISIPLPDGYTDYNEDWYVGASGSLLDKRTGYHIPSDEIDREHWFMHLSEKRWFDPVTFVIAYREAYRRANRNRLEK